MNQDLPQLRMRMCLPVALAPARLPAGYQLREASPADAAGIARVLCLAFDDLWTPDRVRDILLEHPEVPKTFVIENVGEVVATASYQLQPVAYPSSGWVHFVAADPAHSGKGLGRAVTQAVVEECGQRGHQDVLLTTDDFRRAAIRVYLSLGFQPDCWHPSHQTRWAALRLG